MSGMLTKEIAMNVLMSFNIFIKNFLAGDMTKRNVLCAVILNSEGEILAECAYGSLQRHAWTHNFTEIALGKARASLREKMNTRNIVSRPAELMKVGDPPFAGGVYRHGVVVGVSGVQDYFDEGFAAAIAAMCEAFCHHALASADIDFVGNGPPN